VPWIFYLHVFMYVCMYVCTHIPIHVRGAQGWQDSRITYGYWRGLRSSQVQARFEEVILPRVRVGKSGSYHGNGAEW